MLIDPRSQRFLIHDGAIAREMNSAAALSGNVTASRVFRVPSEMLFWLLIVPLYAWVASFTINGPLSLAAPNRDLWQHIAVLNALIDNPWDPRNPFIDSSESSRSFGPFWVAMALIARAFSIGAFDALGIAAIANLTLLATGIYLFGKCWLRSEWGPLALLFTMSLAGSLVPLVHTGFHSVTTLIEGASYPAVTMIALGLILWAVVIRQLESQNGSVARLICLAALSAVGVANHQLGAAIALIVAGCLTCFGPVASLSRRAGILAAMLAGLALSLFWPYHNPLAVVSQIADPRWAATAHFYDPPIFLALMIPAFLGVLGFIRPPMRGQGRPMLIALALFAIAYVAGATPYVPVGHRFLMPMLLLLHIGLAAVSLNSFGKLARLTPRRGLRHLLFAALLFSSVTSIVGIWQFVAGELDDRAKQGDLRVASVAILAGTPGDVGIAAHSVAAWPIVASGRPVLSVPWPEPLIHDLATRQRATDQLFDTRLPLKQRREIACNWDVSTLILDRRVAPQGMIRRLSQEHGGYRRAGNLIRIDIQRSKAIISAAPAAAGAARSA